MSEKGSRARALFEQGYNCAQSVACAFAAEMGLPESTVARLASPFGGGMGRLREVCGAMSGALTVLGMLYGYDGDGRQGVKAALYADVQALAAEFRRQNGYLRCGDLLGVPAESDPTPTERTPEFYKKRPCSDIVESAAEMMEAYIAAHPVKNA